MFLGISIPVEQGPLSVVVVAVRLDSLGGLGSTDVDWVAGWVRDNIVLLGRRIGVFRNNDPVPAVLVCFVRVSVIFSFKEYRVWCEQTKRLEYHVRVG